VTDTAAQPDAYRTTPARLALAGAVAIAAAIVANLVSYLVARAIGAIPDDLSAEAGTFGVPAIVTVCILTIIVATVALGLFDRFSRHPVKNFTILTAIVLFTSLQAPRGIEGAPGSMVATLLVMHVVTAIVAWLALTRLSRASSRTPT
jgi:hypothetical protein